MAGFQHTSLLDFFDKSNASLVKTLADKYGFDAADAMLHIKGIDTSLVLTKTKTKKTKDPNAPKRSPTAFFLFSKQYREEHASDIAGMKASDVQKLAGAAWSEIKDTDAAQSFHADAAKLKVASTAARQRYESERQSTPEPASGADIQVLAASAAPATPDQPTAPVEPNAPVKVNVPKKEKALKKKAVKKPVVPELSLPFLGRIDGCCYGIRNNHGLYTQCTKVPGKGCGNFCKTCFTQGEKNQHGLPNCGTIEGRGEAGWRAPNGQQPVTYMTFLQKSDNQAIIDDHSAAETEAAKFGWTIPAAQWEVKARRSGRPKAAKTAVVTDSSASETESAVPAADLIQKLVAEAQAEQIVVGRPSAAQVESYEAETDSDNEEAELCVATVGHKADTASMADLPFAIDSEDEDEDEDEDEAPLKVIPFTFDSEDEDEDEAPLKVSPFTFDGVAYLLDKSTQDIYCSVVHEKIGVLMTDSAGEQHIQFDDAQSDSDGEDDNDN